MESNMFKCESSAVCYLLALPFLLSILVVRKWFIKSPRLGRNTHTKRVPSHYGHVFDMPMVSVTKISREKRAHDKNDAFIWKISYVAYTHFNAWRKSREDA